MPYVIGTITLGIWAYKAGAWAKLGQVNVNVQEYASSTGTQTVGWSSAFDVAAGAGVTDFGVTIDDTSGNPTTINALYVNWVRQASSAERSATPNGEKGTAVVRP